MGSYVEESLMPGERVVRRGRISLWSLAPLLILGGIFFFVAFAGVLFWLIAWVRYATTEMAVTDRRIIAKTGLISRTTIEMNLQKAESIQVRQGILGRIFNFGSIIVSGGGIPQAPVPGISDPMAFRRAFLEAQEAALSR